MKFFKTDDGSLLPVSEKKFLIPFLTSASPNTKYWDAPPRESIANNYLASKFIQLHQFLDIFKSLGIKLKNKTFIDIGTGNGLIPKTILALGFLKSALGTDLYEPYETESASIPLENKKNLDLFFNFCSKHSKKLISYNNYSHLIEETAEKEVFHPQDIRAVKINKKRLKKYSFKKVGAHDLSGLRKSFDIVYCKGIEHIHNWEEVIKNISSISKKNTYVYFRLRSFFSYLGPHRFSTTAIPWGHVLLNDKEYRRYAKEFHKNREKKMIDSYFNTLSVPRKSVSEMIDMFSNYNFSLVCSKIETPPYVNKITKFRKELKNFWKIADKRYKHVSSAELFSSSYHIIFKKNDV